MNDADLHISVGAIPPSGLSVSERFVHELDLLKGALLYADYVTICSTSLWLSSPLIFLDDFSTQEIVRLMRAVYSDTSQNIHTENRRVNESVLERLEELSTSPWLGADELREKALLEGSLNRYWGTISQEIKEQASHLPLASLRELVKGGTLQIHNLDTSVTSAELVIKSKQQGLDSQAVTDKFIDFIKKALEGGSSLPFFDSSVGSFAQTKIEKGQLAPPRPQLERSKQSALMHDLFKRLPLFETATLDEILDIRRDKTMALPLKRFRKAVFTLSGKMKSPAWDKDFATEADEVFRYEVDVALSEMEEAPHANKYLFQLWDKVTSPTAFVHGGTSILGLATASLAHMPEVVSGIVGIGMGSASLASSVYKNWKAETRKQQQNQLFFYYQSKRALKEMHGKR